MRRGTARAAAMAGAGALAFALIGDGAADNARVAYPAGYTESFLLFNTVDRLDRNVVRFMYVSPDSHAAAAGGAPAQDGTILIMEDHPAVLDTAGEPVLDAAGRLVPGEDVTNVFVMEKRQGWGDAHPAETRNDDWDYGWYLADGSPRPEAGFDGCFACHMNRAGQDFTFTYSAWLRDRDGQ